MAISKRAQTQWNRAQHAYDHYTSYLRNKHDPDFLSFTDLVYVANFKGGSATIAEPINSLDAKLKIYSQNLCGIRKRVGSNTSLGTLPELDYTEIKDLIIKFVSLPHTEDFKIFGLGCSFASALLNFQFPDLVPILDKRAINGSKIEGAIVDKNGNITNLLNIYSALIDYFRAILKKDSAQTLRNLDRELFIQELRRPPFPKKKFRE